MTEKLDRTSSPLDAQDGEEGCDETEDEGSDIVKTESDEWFGIELPVVHDSNTTKGPLPHL